MRIMPDCESHDHVLDARDLRRGADWRAVGHERGAVSELLSPQMPLLESGSGWAVESANRCLCLLL